MIINRKTKRFMEQYEHLFNGSKWYYEFTEEEKEIYRQYYLQEEERHKKFMMVFPFVISIVSLLLVLAKLIHDGILL